MRPRISVDVRLYRAAQYLYPPAFRREFSEEIVRLFDETYADARIAGGRAGLWAFRARMSADLAGTIACQWLRTGWPIVAAASLLYPVMTLSALVMLWQRAPFVLPRVTSEADVVALTVLTAIVLLVIAATIILTLWFTRPLLYRRRL